MSLGAINGGVLALDALTIGGVPVQGGSGGSGISLGVDGSNLSVSGPVYLNSSSNIQFGKLSNTIGASFTAPNYFSYSNQPPLDSDGINYFNTPDGAYISGDVKLTASPEIGITSQAGEINFSLLSKGVSLIEFYDTSAGKLADLSGAVQFISKNSNLTFDSVPGSNAISFNVTAPSGTGVNVELGGSNVVPSASGLNFIDGLGIAFAITDISGVAQITATGSGGAGGISVITPITGVALTNSNVTFTGGTGISFNGLTSSSATLNNTGVIGITDSNGSVGNTLTGNIKLLTTTPSNINFGFNAASNALTFNVPNQGVNVITPSSGGAVNASNVSMNAQAGSGLTITGTGSNTLTFDYVPPTGSGVTSLNTLSGPVVLTPSAGITITPAGSNIALANTGVLTLNGLSAGVSLSAGTGIGIASTSGSNIQVSNTGVSSLTDVAGSNALVGGVKVVGAGGITAAFTTGTNTLTLTGSGAAAVSSLTGTTGSAATGAISVIGATQAIPLGTPTNAITTTSSGSSLTISNNGILCLGDATLSSASILTGAVKVVAGSGITASLSAATNTLTLSSSGGTGTGFVASGEVPLLPGYYAAGLVSIPQSAFIANVKTGTFPTTLNAGFNLMSQYGLVSSSTPTGAGALSGPINNNALTAGTLVFHTDLSTPQYSTYPSLKYILVSN